jgi:hypothetical protein
MSWKCRKDGQKNRRTRVFIPARPFILLCLHVNTEYRLCVIGQLIYCGWKNPFTRMPSIAKTKHQPDEALRKRRGIFD